MMSAWCWNLCCPTVPVEKSYESVVEHELIYSGHYSSVYRVSRGNQVVVLKRFTEGYTSDHEVRAMKQLSHVFIPSVHQSTRDTIVMDYAGSTNLVDWIIEPHTRADRAACDHIFQCIVSAVAHMHARFICHMDIKCDNVVVDFHGNAHLVDFNLSYTYRPDEDEFSIQRPRGTQAYLAPEFSLQYGNVSGYRVDIWGVGIICFVLMFKRIPFHSCGPECKLFREYIRRSRTLTPVEVFYRMYPTIMSRGDLHANHYKTLDGTMAVPPHARLTIGEVQSVSAATSPVP